MQVTGHGPGRDADGRDADGRASSHGSGSGAAGARAAGSDPFDPAGVAGSGPDPADDATDPAQAEGDARPVSLLGLRISEETQPGQATVSRRQNRIRPRVPRPEPGRVSPPANPPAIRRAPGQNGAQAPSRSDGRDRVDDRGGPVPPGRTVPPARVAPVPVPPPPPVPVPPPPPVPPPSEAGGGGWTPDVQGLVEPPRATDPPASPWETGRQEADSPAALPDQPPPEPSWPPERRPGEVAVVEWPRGTSTVVVARSGPSSALRPGAAPQSPAAQPAAAQSPAAQSPAAQAPAPGAAGPQAPVPPPPEPSVASLPTLPPPAALPPAPPPDPSPTSLPASGFPASGAARPGGPHPAAGVIANRPGAPDVARSPAPYRAASPAFPAADRRRLGVEAVASAYPGPESVSRRVLVGGFGGGSGRTTVTAGLGMALAARSHARIAAVDACPDQYGMLTHRVGLRPRGVGLRELTQARPPVESLTELRHYLASEGPGGLEVLPGVHDLTAPGLAPDELAWALDLVAHWFPVVIADAPAGWSQPVPATLLNRSNLVVLTARAGEAELAAAGDALTALEAAGPEDLSAAVTVAVVETYPARLTRAARQRLEELTDRVRVAVTVPFDPALTDGRPFSWRQLRRRTRVAFDELATAVDPTSIRVPGTGPLGPG